MTTSRSQPSEATGVDPSGDDPPRDTPELNCYEIRSGRTVVTEPGNTDGWIATDMTVDPTE